MRNLFISLRAILFFTIVLGVVYPFLIMGVGYMFFKPQATGSRSYALTDGKNCGSNLFIVGAKFSTNAAITLLNRSL
jgi:K+-transporting ATPase ATPase C chain